MKRKLTGWISVFFLLGVMGLIGAVLPVQAEGSYQLFVTEALKARYGQRLEEIALDKVQVLDQNRLPVAGTLTWKEPDKLLQSPGAITETLLFVPARESITAPPEDDGIPEDTGGAAEAGSLSEPEEAGNQAEVGFGYTAVPSTLSQDPGTAEKPLQFSVSVTVQKGKTVITDSPTLTIRTARDGDLLKEAVTITGGGAVCELHTLPQHTLETVAGTFQWEKPDLQLTAGIRELTLLFVPQQPELYETVSQIAKIEVLPREIKIELQTDKTLVKTAQEITLTAFVSDTGKQTFNGSVIFTADGVEIASASAATETEDGWQVQTVWKQQQSGTYEMQAYYIPEDSHAAKAQSRPLTIKAVSPLSQIRTDTLPAGTAGQFYEAELLTDASGAFDVRFSLASGKLPEGLTLKEDTGILSGRPTPGEYDFTVKATEGEASAQRSFRLIIQKVKPMLTLKTKSGKLTGGEDCKLWIYVESPGDISEPEKLPVPKVTFDQRVKTTGKLSGRDGAYTLTFQTENRNTTIRCSVNTEETDFYEAAETHLDIVVKKKTASTEKPADKPAEKPGSSSERESEPEPVVKTKEEVEAEFWQDVIFRIYKAQEKGETVTINAKGHGSMPDKVMEALRQHEKVTLALVWEGDMIVIPAGEAQSYDKKYQAWTLGELSNRYPLSKAEQKPATTPAVTPQQPAKPAVKTPSPAASTGSGGNKGGMIVHTSTEEEEESTEEETTEPETQTETVTEEPETPANTESTEGETLQEAEQGNSTPDWLFVISCVIAAMGIIMIAIAIVTIGRARREEE